MPKKELIPCWPSPKLLLLIPKFKDQARDQKLSEPPPKGELWLGGKFEYPQKLTENTWKFSFPVFSMKHCIILVHCLLLVAVNIKPYLPLEASGRSAAPGKILLSFCKFVVLVYSLQPRDWVSIQMWIKSAVSKEEHRGTSLEVATKYKDMNYFMYFIVKFCISRTVFPV